MRQLISDHSSSLHGCLWAEPECSSFPPLSPQTHCGSHGTHTHIFNPTHTLHSLLFLGGRESDSSLVLSLPNYSFFKSLLAWKAVLGGRDRVCEVWRQIFKKLGSFHWFSMRNTAFPQRVCMSAGNPRGTRKEWKHHLWSAWHWIVVMD